MLRATILLAVGFSLIVESSLPVILDECAIALARGALFGETCRPVDHANTSPGHRPPSMLESCNMWNIHLLRSDAVDDKKCAIFNKEWRAANLTLPRD